MSKLDFESHGLRRLPAHQYDPRHSEPCYIIEFCVRHRRQDLPDRICGRLLSSALPALREEVKVKKRKHNVVLTEWAPMMSRFGLVISGMTRVFFSMAYSLHMARRALNKLRGDVQQQIDEVIGPVIYQVMAREYHDSIHREGLDWIFQEEKLQKYRGDLTTLSRAVHRASLQLDEPHQQGRRLQDNRPPTSGLNLTKNTET